MPPVERLLPRFAAEPPQEELPYGRWLERLRQEFLAAAAQLESDEDLGEPQEVVFYPDRTWYGRTYVPATARTSTELELFGFVRYVAVEGDEQPSDFHAHVDFTRETAERNPDWQLDLCDEVIGSWRGQFGAVAAMTLVWGRPLLSGGRVATAELAEVTVDQCDLSAERFTLIAPDDYRGDLLQIKLFDVKGRELTSESLYSDDDEDADEDEPDDGPSADAG